MSGERYTHKAWAYLKAEIVRVFGEEGAAALWAEHNRLARIDRLESNVVRWRNAVRYYAKAIDAGDRSVYHTAKLEGAREYLRRAEAKLAKEQADNAG